MNRRDFKQLVIEAVEALPERIRRQIENVAFVVEERPNTSMARKYRGRGNTLLLGLYEGVPRTVWGRDFPGKLPDKITIFQEPIEEVAESPERIPQVVRETVWHEIGHYLGFDERRIRALGRKWQHGPPGTKRNTTDRS